MKRILPSAIAALLAGSVLALSATAQSAPATPITPAGGPHQATPGNFADGEVPDGIFRHLGATWIVMKGHGDKVNREMKINEGLTIEPNGTVTFKDGHKVALKGNQMVTFDGQVKDVSPSLTLPDTPIATPAK
jgi:hypothetical protein